MVAKAIYSVTMVLWKETAFPLCRAMERPWKKCYLPGVFHDSGDTPANLLCEFNGHLMPYTSCFYGKWVEGVCAGQFGVFVYLVLAVFWAAAPGLVAVLPMWDSAYVSGTVTSQAIGFPLAHGKRVVPSGRLLLSRIRLIGFYYYCLIVLRVLYFLSNLSLC